MRATAIVSLLTLGTSVLAESPAEDARMTVEVHLLRNVSDGNLNVFLAQSIVSQIFAEAGVHIKWRQGEPTHSEEYVPIIIDLTSNAPKTLAPAALAYAQAYEGVHIKVFLDRVQNTVGGARLASTFLLAHVIAHEIVHILECTDQHSETGLMKARWTAKEIQKMGVHHFSLAPADVRLIHDGLLKRATQKVAGHIDCS